jgi:phospholipid/cholesterol/gamma-HCH transport system substrate-binding protein
MNTTRQGWRTNPMWWAVGIIVVVVAFVAVCLTTFAGGFTSAMPVTLTSDRAGLVMESGAKVKLRGVQVGRVAGIERSGSGPVRLKLELSPEQAEHIPANIDARIRATTAFGAKYVDLVYPEHPVKQHIAAGAVLQSRNVSTEVNTVFQSLVNVMNRVDPPKLNAVLTALAEGVRGRGEAIGKATTATNHVLSEVNPRMDDVADDWRSIKDATDAYAQAAPDILVSLKAFSTTSSTVTSQSADLDALLLSAIGVSQAGIDFLAPNKDTLVAAVNTLAPTTDLLHEYDPTYTCLLTGAKWWLDNGGSQIVGGNGRTVVLDDAFLFGDDPYRYPDNLPIVAAKGGPGGKPSCGSLPDVSKNYPVRQLVTNTGWGTGLDIRPNPGIGQPWWVNFFPVTRGQPEPPSIRHLGPPAIGPVPYSGAPPYGAPLYAPDGTPLYPTPPGAPAPAGAPTP